MYRKAELDQLRLRKELLVLKCDAHRMLLTAEWRHLRSPQSWWSEAGRSARKHPLLAAALGIGAGFIAIKVLRRPGAIFGWLGRLGGAGSTLLSLWKLFRGEGRQP